MSQETVPHPTVLQTGVTQVAAPTSTRPFHKHVTLKGNILWTRRRVHTVVESTALRIRVTVHCSVQALLVSLCNDFDSPIALIASLIRSVCVPANI